MQYAMMLQLEDACCTATSPAITAEAAGPDERDELEQPRDEGEEYRVLDVEHEPEPDVGRRRGIEHHHAHADEITAQYRLEIAPHPGGERPVTRRNEPRQPAADAVRVEKKVPEQDQCQDAAEDAGDADGRQLEDPAVLRHPGLRLVRDHGAHPGGIEPLAHQVERAIPEQDPQEAGDGPLQIGRDPLQLAQQRRRAEQAEERRQSHDREEDREREYPARRSGPLREPVDERSCDESDDGCHHEGQQDGLDEVQENDEPNDHRDGRQVGELLDAAVCRARRRVVRHGLRSALLRSHEVYTRPFQWTRRVMRQRRLSSAMTAPAV